MQVTVGGQPLTLLPQKAAYWPARHTLFIADPHFGKAASFRYAGLYVPPGTTQAALRTIETILEQTHAARIVFLGDFLHARQGRSEQVLQELADWRRQRRDIQMLLVRGNHDHGAGDPPADLGIQCVDAPHLDGPFALAHHPRPVQGSYVLAGHLHPCVALHGKGRQHEQLPCFWFGQEVGVLPAFGEFTGCARIETGMGDRVFVVGQGEVIPVGVPA